MTGDSVHLTRHARERCAEMGLHTSVVKYIVRHADVRRPGNTGTGCMIAICDQQPDYAVVYDDKGDVPVVVTVVFRTTEEYERKGTSYAVKTRRDTL